VYAFWLLCGLITLCGAMTLGELAALLPRAGVAYHALTEAYGPFAGFMQVWMLILVSGPGAIAGVAVLFGELAGDLLGTSEQPVILAWATAAIVFFVLVNLRGVEWGGGIQVVLTAIKIAGLMALIFGGLIIAAPTPASGADPVTGGTGIADLVRVVGLGVAIVLFTYDGWIDVSHIAGEVRNAERTFPLAMAIGVLGITLIYLLVNFAYLRVMTLDDMREAPTLVATQVAEAAFGENGGAVLAAFMTVSIFGALGGLVMTLPRRARPRYRARTGVPCGCLGVARVGRSGRRYPGGVRTRYSGPVLLRLVLAHRDLFRRAISVHEHPDGFVHLPLAPQARPERVRPAGLPGRACRVHRRNVFVPRGGARL
jgi:APA family basic amino acid/polyamine antiporter